MADEEQSRFLLVCAIRCHRTLSDTATEVQTREHQPAAKPDGEVPGFVGEIRTRERDFTEAKRQDIDEDEGKEPIQQESGCGLSKTRVKRVTWKCQCQDWNHPQDDQNYEMSFRAKRGILLCVGRTAPKRPERDSSLRSE